MTVPLRPEYGDPTADELDVAEATDKAMRDLAGRMADQRERLAANGAAFTYDRNGLRLGIAALEDELRELYDEWAANKKRLHAAGVAERLGGEALDVAAAAMLIYTACCRKRTYTED